MTFGDDGRAAWSRWKRAARDALRARRSTNPRGEMIHSGLTAAYERAGDSEPLDLSSARLVIFSDHHRGGGTGEDDFRRCQRAYRAALAHYLESGHELVLLGDVEELWESRLPKPLDTYPDVLALERDFHRKGRLRRVFGNHDLVWSRSGVVQKYLGDHAGFGDIEVSESIRFEIRDGDDAIGELFLTHGHQGTPDSDLWAPLAMLPVRYVWPLIQRTVGFASTTPSIDYALRGEHDQLMYAWAQTRSRSDWPLVLVTGHTHKPVFRRRLVSGGLPGGVEAPTVEQAKRDLDEARREVRPAEEIATLHAMLQYVSTPDYGAPAVPMKTPCYFNTGCCSYGDGDVTGIEIADGKIRLIRWLDDDEAPVPCHLDEAKIRTVLEEIRAAADG